MNTGPAGDEDRAPYRHRLRSVIRFADLDAMGHLNNVALLGILETGRIEYFVDLGLGSHRELTFVLASIHVDFRAQAFYRDEIVCGGRTSRLGGKSMAFDQEVWRPSDGVTVATARSILVTLGEDQETTVRLPDRWRQLIAEWEPHAVEGSPG